MNSLLAAFLICCMNCCCCSCCCWSTARLSEQARPPEGKQTVSRGMPQVIWAAYVMLRHNVRECWTVGHYVCEVIVVSATECANFVDGLIYSLLVSCQSFFCCCCFASACLAEHGSFPLRAINCFVTYGTKAIPRVRYSTHNG